MSDAKDLAKKALQRIAGREHFARSAADYAEPAATDYVEKPQRGSQDALDHRAFRKGGFSKAEKREYAKQKFAEELVQPPKNPPPEWLSNPDLLPKKPPKRSDDP